MLKVKWDEIKAVIFDVDGTLYDQGKMRRRMLVELGKYYIMHLWHVKDLKIISDFRDWREKNVNMNINNLSEAQYIWAAQAAHVSLEKVKNVINKWIYQVPLKYIYDYRYSGVEELFKCLYQRHIKIAIFSDYLASEKIETLKLTNCTTFSSIDKEINVLKPDPKGLFYIAKTLNIPIEECLLIGDRDDRDGECARRAGMKYSILERKPSGLDNRFHSYEQLIKQLEDLIKIEETIIK